MNHHLCALAALLSAALSLEAALFFGAADPQTRQWSRKDNTALSIAPESRAAITVATAEFNYGWIHRTLGADLLPPPDTAGLYGHFRADGADAGLLAVYLILARQSSVYFRRAVGALAESEGRWIEFYLPLSQFRSESMPLTLAGIDAKTKLQFSVEGIRAPTVTVEIEGLRWIPRHEADAIERRAGRAALARKLRPPDETAAAPHPRLLLTPDRLQRIRARIGASPEAAAVYSNLVAYCETALKSFPADAPFGALTSTVAAAPSPQAKHQARAAIESLVTAAARPIEILAAVWMISGDERYARHAARALAAAAESVDHTHPALNEGFYYTRTFYVRALAFGYDWLYHFLTPDERLRVQTTLLGFVTSIHEQSLCASWGARPLQRVWNWDPGLVSAAGVGMLALEGETRVAEKNILFELRRHLRDYLTLGIDADGCGHEGPAYLGYGIGAGPEFAECLRQQGRGDLFLDTNWKKIAPWLVSELLPDRKRWNNLSDCGHSVAVSPPVSYLYGRIAQLAAEADPSGAPDRMPPPPEQRTAIDFLAQFSERPGDLTLSWRSHAALLAWLWQSTLSRSLHTSQISWQLAWLLLSDACPPGPGPEAILPAAVHFRGRGLAVSRSDFGTNGLYLAVEAGPHAAGHDQADKGAFTLYGYGSDLAIDSGYGNDGLPLASGSSHAHNMVLVNGEGQPMHWHNQSSAQITGYHHGTLLDWIRVDAADAWNIRYDRDLTPLATGVNIAKAERSFLFVRGSEHSHPYLVVADAIRAQSTPAAYTWLWHIAPDMQFDLQRDRWICRPQLHGAYTVLTSSADSARGRAQFTFTAPRSATYQLNALVRAATEPAAKADSFFVRINGGERRTWHLLCRDTFMWSSYRADEAYTPEEFELAADETLTVEIAVREAGAELAQLALTATDSSADALIIDAAQAAALDPPFRLREVTVNRERGSMAVFPVTTPASAVKTALYATSRQGLHPRLEHTVSADEPRFLMVMVPFAPGMALPHISRIAMKQGTGATVQWPGCRDLIYFSDGAAIENETLRSDAAALFIRRDQNGKIIDWKMLGGTRLSLQPDGLHIGEAR